MMAYPLPRLGVPLPPGRPATQHPMSVARSQEGGTSPTCCGPVPVSASVGLSRPPGCLGAPPGSLCSCCPPGSTLLHGYPGGFLTGLPEGMASHPYLSAPGLPGVPPDSPALYPTLALGGAFDPKDNHEFWAALRQSPYFPYEQGLMAHPYANAFALDPNARRKNATREGTNTLKAWLGEHKKNPYPTKGEKIMLAIITKMTLTQVSTWFANARRRLKKDNKVTWTTRGTDDDDDALLSSDDEEKANRKSEEAEADDEDICVTDDDMDDPLQTRLSPAGSLASPELLRYHRDREQEAVTSSSLPDHPETRKDGDDGARSFPKMIVGEFGDRKKQLESQKPSGAKPKIWSLADVASKDSDTSGGEHSPTLPTVHTGGHYPSVWRSTGHPYAYPRPSMLHRPLRIDTSPHLSSATVSSSSSSAAATIGRRSLSPDQ